MTSPVHAQTQADSVALAFMQELNAMRANPAGFIPTINAYKKQVASFNTNKNALNKAVSEIIAILKKQQPLGPLSQDSSLMHAATDHMRDGAKAGFMGHYGSDGSDPGKRAARYGRFTTLSEAITYGNLSTSLMLAAFLVDEGTPSRGHRATMLGSQYTVVGAAFGPHPTYDWHLVVLLGAK